MSIDRLNSIIGITAAARLCGLSERWIRHLADSGRISMVRDSLGRRLFDRAEVLKFARTREKQRQGPEGRNPFPSSERPTKTWIK